MIHPSTHLLTRQVRAGVKVGQTPQLLFGGIAPGYSECLADLVALCMIAEQDRPDGVVDVRERDPQGW